MIKFFEIFHSRFFLFLEHCLFRSQVHFFLNGSFALYYLFIVFWTLYIFWILIPLSHTYITVKDCLPFCELPFHPIVVPFGVQKLYSFMKSQLSIVALNSWQMESFLKSFSTHNHEGHCLCLLLAVLVFLGVWSTWSQFLCKVINIGLTAFFFCMWTSSPPPTFCWRCFDFF